MYPVCSACSRVSYSAAPDGHLDTLVVPIFCAGPLRRYERSSGDGAAMVPRVMLEMKPERRRMERMARFWLLLIDGYSVVTCTERVLDACAQIMRERHQGEEMSRHVYLVLVGQLYCPWTIEYERFCGCQLL